MVEKQSNANLRQALTLHASLDNGLDADFATGDAKFRHGPSIARQDELAVFNRALTGAEVRQLHGLKNGVRDIHPGKK